MPIDIADAPANINSNASFVFDIPPIPIIGIRMWLLTSHTILRAIGFIAGPDSPAFPMPVVKVFSFELMPIAASVFIRDTAVEPELSAATAMSVIDVTLGVNFVMTGLLNLFTTPSTNVAKFFGLLPISSPPSSIFGHETLISIAST